MVTYLDQLIGFEYAESPLLWTLCFMMICWFAYLFIQFIYFALWGKR